MYSPKGFITGSHHCYSIVLSLNTLRKRTLSIHVTINRAPSFILLPEEADPHTLFDSGDVCNILYQPSTQPEGN